MSRLLVLGDIHGAARALDQVLERSNFDPSSDRLVFLGDVCDGWSETSRVMDILTSIPNLTFILGNHDEWLIDWIIFNKCAPEWWYQGGKATINSYNPCIHSIHTANNPHASSCIPAEHQAVLKAARSYHEEDNMVFTHGGFKLINRTRGISLIDPPNGGWSWDRMLWQQARSGNFTNLNHPYSKVFIGHTSTAGFSTTPVFAAGIMNLDQGAGWAGKLTLMDAHTEEYWQSDPVQDLYPDERGR